MIFYLLDRLFLKPLEVYIGRMSQNLNLSVNLNTGKAADKGNGLVIYLDVSQQLLTLEKLP